MFELLIAVALAGDPAVNDTVLAQGFDSIYSCLEALDFVRDHPYIKNSDGKVWYVTGLACTREREA